MSEELVEGMKAEGMSCLPLRFRAVSLTLSEDECVPAAARSRELRRVRGEERTEKHGRR